MISEWTVSVTCSPALHPKVLASVDDARLNRLLYWGYKTVIFSPKPSIPFRVFAGTLSSLSSHFLLVFSIVVDSGCYNTVSSLCYSSLLSFPLLRLTQVWPGQGLRRRPALQRDPSSVSALAFYVNAQPQ